MASALVLHSGYTKVEVAYVRDGRVEDRHQVAKHQASRDLISVIDLLLERNQLSLSDCAFLGAHVGPAPFTTLRVVLSTVNGCGFGAGLPLVPVDGLDAFIKQEEKRTRTPYLIVLLNAFCDDVYFAIVKINEYVERGCEPIGVFIKRLEHELVSGNNDSAVATVVGNGLLLHQALLQEHFGSRLVVPAPLVEESSLDAITAQAWHEWTERRTFQQLLPLYLKDSSAVLCSMGSAQKGL